MEKSELHQWSRHYDSLLWNVTALFAAAIGGLLVYASSTPDLKIALFGLFVTWFPVYFAASFRESRDKVNLQLPEGDRKILFDGRGFKQWEPFVVLFLGFQVLWPLLLLEKDPEQWGTWLILGTLAVMVTIVLYCLGKRPTVRNLLSK